MSTKSEFLSAVLVFAFCLIVLAYYFFPESPWYVRAAGIVASMALVLMAFGWHYPHDPKR